MTIKEAILEGTRLEGIEEGIEIGIQEGIEIGIKEGIKEGIEIGIKEGIERIEKAIDLLKSGAASKEIAKKTKLPLSTICDINEIINKKK